MDAGVSFFTYWYYHLPNYALAVLLYACIGRFILGLFAPANWDNFIWKGFIAVSEPAIKATRFVTPDAVPPPVLIIFAMIWLVALRILFFFEMARWGLAPRLMG